MVIRTRSADHRVHSPVQILSQEATMDSLLDPRSGWWNYNLINSVFIPSEAAKVCNVVPSPLRQEDKQIWTASKSGCFMVRSAYHLEMSRRAQKVGESSMSGENQKIWKAIWSWNFPHSLKNFLWKLGRNILTTRENLFRKGIVEDPFCPFCLSSSESTFHALWSCQATTAVWQECGRKIQKMVLEEEMGSIL